MNQKNIKGISLKNVSAGYKGKTIIKDIDLYFPAGKITAILGENGSGKTTLLRAMAGLIKYDGSISIDGEELSDMTSRKRAAKIAMLAQMNSAYFSFTVEETVKMGRYRFSKGIFSESDKNNWLSVEKCMQDADITDIRKKYIGELSGGQLQRVYLAQMFAQDSEYIFLDEPTNHLDLKYRSALEQRLLNSNKSVVMVYHDIATALKIAHQIVLIKYGNVTAVGSPAEIISNGSLNEAFSMDVISYLGLNKKII